MTRTPLRRVGKRGMNLRMLDRLLREVVLRRDGNKCRFGVQCLFIRSHGTTGRGHALQAMHIYGKGAHPALRYELKNVVAGCQPLHHWWHQNGFGREAEDRDNLVRKFCIETLGKDYMDHLDMLSQVRKGANSDNAAIKLMLEAELRKLS